MTPLSSRACTAVATIYQLVIDRFRGIKALSWHPTKGANVILGGGDVGKTTILDAFALLFQRQDRPRFCSADANEMGELQPDICFYSSEH
jgi:predicted ATP-dependent endonuclease of OLD family